MTVDDEVQIDGSGTIGTAARVTIRDQAGHQRHFLMAIGGQISTAAYTAHGIGQQPKLQPCHQHGNLCHPGWTRHLVPSGDRKPLVMCGHGLYGEAPLRRM